MFETFYLILKQLLIVLVNWSIYVEICQLMMSGTYLAKLMAAWKELNKINGSIKFKLWL